MANEKISTARKQTYPFKSISVGDSFTIKKSKYNSMLTAYRYHNKNFDNIKIQSVTDGANCIITRIS